MAKMKDLTGKTFGLWTVIRQDKLTKSGMTWICKCTCGTEKSIPARRLPRTGLVTWCTCNIVKHGLKGTRAYNSWAHMIQRCTNPNSKDFNHYGGRGITICKRWLTFLNFFEDMGQPPKAEYSLGRIDNEQGYEPKNVRWEDNATQRRNTRRNFMVSHHGKTQCITEWARDLGVDRKMLSCCIRYGMPVEIALDPKTWPLAHGRIHANSKPPK